MNVKMAETMAQNEQVDELSILDNISDENSIQLGGAMNEVFGNSEPGKFLNGHESKDKNYMVYEYTIKSGGTPESVRYQAVKQGIAKSKNGIQITDANIKEYDKDYKFKAGDKVYVRIPKTELKESNHIPGKVEYIGNKKDKLNRNWKCYSYTFLQGGTIGGVKRKWESQIGSMNWLKKFCDENGNELEQERFGKGETIYIRVPDEDIVDPTPEMTIDEIMSMPDDGIIKVSHYLEEYNNSIDKDFFEHADKKGYYHVINGRKVYDARLFSGLNTGTPYFSYEVHESITNVYNVAIWMKDGNGNYKGIFYDYDKVYRGKLVQLEGAYNLTPEHYGQ